MDGASSPIDFPDPASAGYGLDFNPTVDRVRVVTSTGLNFRINPSTGAPVDGSVGTSGVNLDSNINGAVSGVNGVGYTNSYAGAVTTVLYTLDATSNALYIQNPANNGTQNAVASVTLGGNPLDFSARLGMDVPPFFSNNAYAILTVGGVTNLYTIDLTTGAATNIGALGAGSTPVMGLAVGDIEAR